MLAAQNCHVGSLVWQRTERLTQPHGRCHSFMSRQQQTSKHLCIVVPNQPLCIQISQCRHSHPQFCVRRTLPIAMLTPKMRFLRRGTQVVKVLLAIYALRKVLQQLPLLLKRYRTTRRRTRMASGKTHVPDRVRGCFRRKDKLGKILLRWCCVNSPVVSTPKTSSTPNISLQWQGLLRAVPVRPSCNGPPRRWPRPSSSNSSARGKSWRPAFGGSKRSTSLGDQCGVPVFGEVNEKCFENPYKSIRLYRCQCAKSWDPLFSFESFIDVVIFFFAWIRRCCNGGIERGHASHASGGEVFQAGYAPRMQKKCTEFYIKTSSKPGFLSRMELNSMMFVGSLC